MKKIITTLFASVILLSTLATSAYANTGEYIIGNSVGHDFTDPWRAYETTRDGNGLLTYGFNTFMIDEDYSWAEHETAAHFASIENDNGWHYGLISLPGFTSKIEVTHAGSFIKYLLEY